MPRDASGAGASLSPLRLDSSCCRNLNWRCDLDAEVDAERFESALAAGGYALRCRHPALRVLRRGGHEVAWVLSTGRLQVRVGIFVDPEAREAVARSLHAELAAWAVAAAEAPPKEGVRGADTDKGGQSRTT